MELNSMASYYFHQGTNYNSYKYLGCNVSILKRKYIYTFRTWAPSATSVSIVSDFGGWNSPIYMHRVTDNGVWEYSFESEVSLVGKAYKFRIERDGKFFLKGDP